MIERPIHIQIREIPYLQQFVKTMQQLIGHLFRKYVTDTENQLTKELCLLKPILLSELKPTQEELQLIQYLLAKNIVCYSATHLTITLNIQMVLSYQRIQKLRQFSSQHLEKQFGELLDKFIGNQFLPVALPEKKGKIMMPGGRQEKHEAKGKKKKEELEKEAKETKEGKEDEKGEGLEHCRLFYEYSGKESGTEVEFMVNFDELTSQIKWFKIEKWLGKERVQEMGKQFSESKRQFFLQLNEGSRESSSRSETSRKALLKIREEKVEEYILQTFRKYDEEGAERCSLNCLLVFNIIRKHPLVTEKEILELSLLLITVQRKCLNLLIQEGFMHYYPENTRSYVYRITEFRQLEEQLVIKVAQSVRNVHVLMENGNVSKDQLLKLECMLWDLDDILLIFID